MTEPSDEDVRETVRERFIGLDEHTLRKSYYPELQRRLRELERFRVLLNQSTDGILLVSPGRVEITDLNDTACRQLGLSRAEAIGRHLPDLLVFKGPVGAFALAEGTDADAMLLSATLPGPEARRVEVSLSSSHFEGERFLIAVMRDVSERERLEADLARARRVESIGLLAGGIAHDFNNILTAISANVSLVRAACGSMQDTGWGETLLEVEEAAVRARDLTQQLLTFARGGAPVKQAASVGELLEQSIAFALRGSRVRPTFDVPESLPPVDADPSQLSQVFNNLALNARDAMPRGGRLFVTAHVAHARGQHWVRVTVDDEGTGIPTEVLDHIFEPYFTTKREGHGLGLATSFSIVQRHGGWMSAQGRGPRGGASFVIDLPIAEGPVAVAEPAPAPSPTRSLLVLAVDDDAAIRRLLTRLIDLLGHGGEVVASGQEALGAWRRARTAGVPFDVVVTDLTIPGGMGGVDLARELHALDPELPVIASSGYSDDPVMSDAAAWGFQAVLVKPYRLDDLRRVLDATPAAATAKQHSAT